MLADIDELLATVLLTAHLELLQFLNVLRNQFGLHLSVRLRDDLGDLSPGIWMRYALATFLQQVQQEGLKRRSLVISNIKSDVMSGR